ncbi:MAG: carbohydrate-binding domain-containing protein [Actinobacteria bacterium]|nr:carbohydrate-binding domain-containing protein [Actinomycetota bacterium]
MSDIRTARRIARSTLAVTVAAVVLFGAFGCGDRTEPTTTTSVATAGDDKTTATTVTAVTAIASEPTFAAFAEEDLSDTWDSATASLVILAGDSIRFEGRGATVAGSRLTITSPGTYVISGVLDGGQILVESEDKGSVRLVLKGADISCSTSAPIHVLSAGKTIITLAEGTENRVSDDASGRPEEAGSDDPNAAIFSKDDLTINGSGSLTVSARYNNGIATKDDLRIAGGSITVEAANDALKGRDSIGVRAGTITVDAGGDGLQANNSDDLNKGYVSIEGGVFDIIAGSDGIQAETTLVVSGGDLSISTGGTTADDSTSAKGLKAGTGVFVTGGAFVIDSSDDAVHSDGVVKIDGGILEIASGDDGIHADKTLEINGGYITIDSGGDGLDCNGPVFMTGGTVIINGPADDRDGALDYLSEFTITGGYLVAVGSSGMAETPSETSGQHSIMVNLDQAQKAGTLIHIESTMDEDILTMAPTKQFQSVVLSSPAIEAGETYKVYLGGTSTGTVTDTVYSDGTYTPGTEYVSLTIEGMVTVVGAGGGMDRGGRPDGGGRSSGGRP